MKEQEFICDRFNLRCIEPPCRTMNRCPYFDCLRGKAEIIAYSRICKARQGALCFLDDDMRNFPALQGYDIDFRPVLRDECKKPLMEVIK